MNFNHDKDDKEWDFEMDDISNKSQLVEPDKSDKFSLTRFNNTTHNRGTSDD